jgi:hypothetical protein
MTHEERTALIARYAAGVAAVEAALDGFPADGLTAHPLPGKWSAREIVHHLADSETHSAIRIRLLLAQPNPVILPYDQEAWARELAYNTRDHAESLEAFRYARRTTVPLLESMRDADWNRQGWHPEHGLYTPETWLRIYAAHAHGHADQIRRLRDALKR